MKTTHHDEDCSGAPGAPAVASRSRARRSGAKDARRSRRVVDHDHDHDDHDHLAAAPRLRPHARVERLRRRLPVRHPHRPRRLVQARPGETVGLALIRRPASAPDQRLGSLVVNYGGPGRVGGRLPAAGVWSRMPQTVLDRFDVVSFDPRGIGASRPVDCVDDAFLDLSAGIAPVPTTPEQLDVLHQYNAAFAAGCKTRTGAFAGQVGTRNVARDLEAIRIALGDAAPQLPRVLLRHRRRRDVRADVPRVGGSPGARRSARLLDQRARLRVPSGQGVHGRARGVPRLVPADRVLAGRVGCTAGPAHPTHRARRPGAAARRRTRSTA